MSGCAEGVTVLVLAKAPRPGLSKTRLAPRYGAQGAATLAAAALADTLEVVLGMANARRRVLVLDGPPELVAAAGFAVLPQCAGSHAQRIAAALESADGPAVLIGMDTPQLRPDLLALDLAAPVDAWLGRAEDGGWWALGLRHPRRDARRVLDGVPMSTAHTGAVQRDRLLATGLRVADLAPLRDVDEPDDAVAVAAIAPHTRFARCLTDLEHCA